MSIRELMERAGAVSDGIQNHKRDVEYEARERQRLHLREEYNARKATVDALIQDPSPIGFASVRTSCQVLTGAVVYFLPEAFNDLMAGADIDVTSVRVTRWYLKTMNETRVAAQRKWMPQLDAVRAVRLAAAPRCACAAGCERAMPRPKPDVHPERFRFCTAACYAAKPCAECRHSDAKSMVSAETIDAARAALRAYSPRGRGDCGPGQRIEMAQHHAAMLIAERDAPRIAIRCPACTKRHVDHGVWAHKLHRVHRCVDDACGDGCGHEWTEDAYITDPDAPPPTRFRCSRCGKTGAAHIRGDTAACAHFVFPHDDHQRGKRQRH